MPVVPDQQDCAGDLVFMNRLLDDGVDRGEVGRDGRMFRIYGGACLQSGCQNYGAYGDERDYAEGSRRKKAGAALRI
jgi:hypothetical protein